MTKRLCTIALLFTSLLSQGQTTDSLTSFKKKDKSPERKISISVICGGYNNSDDHNIIASDNGYLPVFLCPIPNGFIMAGGTNPYYNLTFNVKTPSNRIRISSTALGLEYFGSTHYEAAEKITKANNDSLFYQGYSYGEKREFLNLILSGCIKVFSKNKFNCSLGAGIKIGMNRSTPLMSYKWTRADYFDEQNYLTTGYSFQTENLKNSNTGFSCGIVLQPVLLSYRISKNLAVIAEAKYNTTILLENDQYTLNQWGCGIGVNCTL